MFNFRLYFLITILFITACGVKGPPVLPRQIQPPAVSDLKAELKEGILNLTWTIPKSENKKAATAGFTVYRSKTPISKADCEKCPVVYQGIGTFPLNAGDIKRGGVRYSESLEKGFRYIYKVTGHTDQGVYSEDSNVVRLVY